MHSFHQVSLPLNLVVAAAFVDVVVNQILFSFNFDQDRRTDSRIGSDEKTQRSPAGNRTQDLANSSRTL